MAAKGGSKDLDRTPVSDWCDLAMLEAAFKRETKGSNEATLSNLKNIINDGKVYSHIQITPFPTWAVKKKLSLDIFKTHGWFLLMTKDNAKDAEKLAKKIVDCECSKQAKKEPKKGDDVTSRLTDTSKYTGAHKERFDADGKGKGIEGRETRVKNDGYTGQYKMDGTYDKTKGSAGSCAADDITKRLTDTKLYTGAHKERFDADGKGKGAAGRETRTENTGYTGQYKGAGTYGKK